MDGPFTSAAQFRPMEQGALVPEDMSKPTAKNNPATTAETILSWSTNNVFDPAYNAVVVQPWNAIATTVNGVSSLMFNAQPLGKLSEAYVQEASGAAWFVQNASAGIGCAVTYALVGRATRSVLTGAVSTIGLEGALAQRLTSPFASQIIGASIYDGLRDPRKGETRLGNALAGAVAFSTLEAGNKWALTGLGADQLARRALVGSIAGTLQVGTSSIVSRGQLPDWHTLENAAISGGSMNVLLPTLQRIGMRESKPQVENTTNSKSAETPVTTAETPVTSAKPEFFQDRLVERRLVVGIEGQTEGFENYSNYVDSGHGYTSMPYRVLKLTNFPGVELHVPETEAARYERLSDSELVTAIKSVPDANMFKSVSVIDFPHSDQAWMRHTLNDPSATIYGDVNQQREVSLYKPKSIEATTGTINHEWWHVLRFDRPKEAAVFDLVKGKEPAILAKSHEGFAANNTAETWSDLGQAMTSSPPEMAALTAFVNPVRASILGKVLGRKLAEVPTAQQAPLHSQFVQLVDHINTVVRPRALETLSTWSQEHTQDAQLIREFLK